MRMIRSTFKIVLATMVATAVLMGGAFFFLSSWNPFGSETIDRSGPTMLVQIRDLAEFTAAEGSFTQDVDIEVNTKYMPGFISGSRVVAIVSGSVDATVDFSQLGDDAVKVDEDGGEITVELPQPVLKPAKLDLTSTRIIDRKRGLVQRVSGAFGEHPVDDNPVFVTAEERLDAAAAESDLVARARKNTEEWMTMFLGAAGFEKVTVNWVD